MPAGLDLPREGGLRAFAMDIVPQVLTIEEEDARRPEIEALLARLPEPDLRALWGRTRSAAAAARATGDMERLFGLVRGTKTIQRIAGARGIVILARPVR